MTHSPFKFSLCQDCLSYMQTSKPFRMMAASVLPEHLPSGYTSVLPCFPRGEPSEFRSPKPQLQVPLFSDSPLGTIPQIHLTMTCRYSSDRFRLPCRTTERSFFKPESHAVLSRIWLTSYFRSRHKAKWYNTKL